MDGGRIYKFKLSKETRGSRVHHQVLAETNGRSFGGLELSSVAFFRGRGLRLLEAVLEFLQVS